jgi:hypothetical protein
MMTIPGLALFYGNFRVSDLCRPDAHSAHALGRVRVPSVLTSWHLATCPQEVSRASETCSLQSCRALPSLVRSPCSGSCSATRWLSRKATTLLGAARSFGFAATTLQVILYLLPFSRCYVRVRCNNLSLEGCRRQAHHAGEPFRDHPRVGLLHVPAHLRHHHVRSPFASRESRVLSARGLLLARGEGKVERSWRAALRVAAGSAHPGVLLAGVRSSPAPSPSA